SSFLNCWRPTPTPTTWSIWDSGSLPPQLAVTPASVCCCAFSNVTEPTPSPSTASAWVPSSFGLFT
ncbi:uncharacterized protein METZ01_LOCUS512976, partial [marine metagenome]